MLDEEEYAVIAKVYANAFGPGQGQTIDERFKPVRDEYERMTGLAGCHQNAIKYHRIASYGPACATCGKPLRTPRASFCAACGQPVVRQHGEPVPHASE